MTVLASIPSLLLLIALIIVLGTGTLQVCIALGVTGWVSFCRISRGETLKLREADFVQAARALGTPETRIITKHILPNLAHLVVITFALLFTGLVLVGNHPVLSRHRAGKQLGADDRPGAQRIVAHADHLVEHHRCLGRPVCTRALGQSHRRCGARYSRSENPAGAAMNDVIARLDGLSVTFPATDGRANVLDGVSLDVRRG